MIRFTTWRRQQALRVDVSARPNLFQAQTIAPDVSLLELSFLRDVAPHHALMRAVREADEAAVPVLDALLADSQIDAVTLTQSLAKRLGTGAVLGPLPADIALTAKDVSAAGRSGILRLADGSLLVAMRGKPILALLRLLRERPQIASRIWLAPSSAFTTTLLIAAGDDLAHHSAMGPERIDPALTVRSPNIVRASLAVFAAIGLLSLLAAVFFPLLANIGFGVLFLTLTVLRLLAVWPDPPESPQPRTPDHVLPVYTVLVPLFRERACFGQMMSGLQALDYPASKLDVKFLVETGDTETLDEVARHHLPNHFEVLIVPPGEPRTKPRALNTGLALAHGDLLTVFDAEDRPEPGQLRAAYHAFAKGGPRLACVQARLVIDNARDSWLTRIFALEYAGLFDALLPALARSRILFPLGGTSNHFRTDVLRAIGGWDAWNVTEDADLGLRLARLGYRARVIASATLEEAPNRIKAWIRQRTRWQKGYMLTWTVHMRDPGRLYRELGLINFLAFHAFVGGVPVSAVVLPIFLCGVGVNIATGFWLSSDIAWHTAAPILMHGVNLVLGFGTAMALAAIGADRRGLHSLIGWIPTVPFYWLLSSLAAWRAIWQLAGDPYRWEKTEHGLARTSMKAASSLKDGA